MFNVVRICSQKQPACVVLYLGLFAIHVNGCLLTLEFINYLEFTCADGRYELTMNNAILADAKHVPMYVYFQHPSDSLLDVMWIEETIVKKS